MAHIISLKTRLCEAAVVFKLRVNLDCSDIKNMRLVADGGVYNGE